MKNFFNNYKKKDCNGCGLCALKCPQKAITILEDEEGFMYPVINKEKCINCELCKKICTNNPDNKNTPIATYVGRINDEKSLYLSASGGMFYSIATYVINHGGIVFGVKYDENLVAVHSYTDKLSGIKEFQGSKYVRSDLKNSYNDVEKFLEDGKLVLFTGTPCQCAGLRGFISRNNEKLITCDIICHANSSPKIFELYKENLELKYKKKIKDIQFRSKKTGWNYQVPLIIFNDNSYIEDDSYHEAFVSELINRPSCYYCRFCSVNRFSDFSIGDAWGFENYSKIKNNKNLGLSLLNINTQKGIEVFNSIKNNLTYELVETRKAFKYNHNCNVDKHFNRERFFKKLSKGEINEENIIENLKKYSKTPVAIKIIRKIKRKIKNK